MWGAEGVIGQDMVGWLIRATFGTVVLALVGYVTVAIPVGRRTLFEHVAEIARTQPAQELASDVEATAAAAYLRVRARLASREAADR